MRNGFTLVELLTVLAIASLVLFGLQRALSGSAQITAEIEDGIELDRSARYALERMVQGVRTSPQLLIPTADDPTTDWFEDVRTQSVPAVAPTGSSLLDTAVLAMALPYELDANNDGFPDADNDRDGRINEDFPADMTNDGQAGLIGIDDDGDGRIDEEVLTESDDETDVANEDWLNGRDDDNDGRVDEDTQADMNDDGFAGVGGVDDDNDGLIDEGSFTDDDEDGPADEDWLDTQVYYLAGDTLIERRSVPWDASGDGSINGQDFVESPLVDNVRRLAFTRLSPPLGGEVVVQIDLEVADARGQSISLQAQVQLAGGAGGMP